MSASAGAQQNSFAPQGAVKLTDGWKVQSSAKIQATGELLSTPAASTDGWYDATVPSTLMAVLTHHPQPLTDYPSTLFNVSWWYRTTFTLNAQQKPLQSPITTHQSPDTTPSFTLEGWNVKETTFSSISLTDAYEVVPRPQSIETVEGAPFQLTADVQILAPEALSNEASFLQTYIKDLLGLQLPLVSRKQPGKRYIELSVSPDVKEKEGYVLTVSDKTITINGIND